MIIAGYSNNQLETQSISKLMGGFFLLPHLLELQTHTTENWVNANCNKKLSFEWVQRAYSWNEMRICVCVVCVSIRVLMDFNYSPSRNWNTRFTPFTSGHSLFLSLFFRVLKCVACWATIEFGVDNLVVTQLRIMRYERVRVMNKIYGWPSA